jgi:hypothetical protein
LKKFYHKTTRKSGGGWGDSAEDQKTTRISCDGAGSFHYKKFTARPQENLVVGVGFGKILPQDHKKILWWVGVFNHKTRINSCGLVVNFFQTLPPTTRFSCGLVVKFFDPYPTTRFSCGLVVNFFQTPYPPQDFLVVLSWKAPHVPQ